MLVAITQQKWKSLENFLFSFGNTLNSLERFLRPAQSTRIVWSEGIETERTGQSVPVRILFIAPQMDGLDSQPEIRDISSRRHIQVMVLNGQVSSRDIYSHAREGFDVIHFVAHGGEEGICLSDNYLLSYQEIAQIAKLANTKIIFFNSCETGKPASYVVHHGVLWAIYGNIEIADDTAWQHPMGFYSSLHNLKPETVVNALRIADNASGDYGYTISLQYLLNLLQERNEPALYTFKPWQVILIGLTFVVSVLLMLIVVFIGVNNG